MIIINYYILPGWEGIKSENEATPGKISKKSLRTMITANIPTFISIYKIASGKNLHQGRSTHTIFPGEWNFNPISDTHDNKQSHIDHMAFNYECLVQRYGEAKNQVDECTSPNLMNSKFRHQKSSHLRTHKHILPSRCQICNPNQMIQFMLQLVFKGQFCDKNKLLL